MNNKPKYYLKEDGEFVIENYHLAKPFSSFFPGIAGLWGVPLWVFYVNRGQAIAGFGIKDKDHPIVEFQPANKAYQLTSLTGFRTFIKINSQGRPVFYEPFHSIPGSGGFSVESKMLINSYELKLKEINHTLGLETEIEYFTIPNDNFGALARKVTVKNTGRKKRGLEVLDGLPQIIPYGTNNFFLKELSRTIEAWMEVENLKDRIPYFRLRVDPSDRPEVTHIREGNFYLAFDGQCLLKPVVDPEAIFASVSDFTYPENFFKKGPFVYPKRQLTASKTPCSFVCSRVGLKPREPLEIYSLIGNMDSLEKLRTNAGRICKKAYFTRKQAENKQLIRDLQEASFTHSSSRHFDFYCAQNFLDNVLRGGYPLSLKNNLFQVYSRKHGDLERDYNKFFLEPAYFSQGNGNYRDANQNRRNDVWFNPHVLDYDILTFFNLLQTDGYNPLVLKPDQFVFQGNAGILEKFFSGESLAKVKKHLEKPFSPGELILFIERDILGGLGIFKQREEFLNAVLSGSERLLNADHGEGFWIDHWHYCLDLLESYLKLYPENLRHILLEKKEFTFFDNSETVRPRKEKYVLRGDKVFQYHSLANNHQKHLLIKKREQYPHVSRARNGTGEPFEALLAVKMLVVIANKFSSLDPFGAGVEMDADKPNWFDSLNGLPGLLGSSSCETFELKRWIIFLKNNFAKLSLSSGFGVGLPFELHNLLSGLKDICLQDGLSDYVFWDKTHSIREDYLQKTLFGFEGGEKQIPIEELNAILECFLKKIESGLEKAYDWKQKLHYSYFINEVIEYEALGASEHAHIIKPLKFRQRPLPLFLEGPVHYLRIADGQREAREVFQAVRKSPLYDKKIGMYKVTAPLAGMPEEIGRCRVFTPGWLENESIWLHMEYKYLLELLKNGLYEEFFADFKQMLIPFQDPGRYGRSILENSSFLVSSCFSDARLHGNGFVARLSGSTAEFISIWLLMCMGKEPFYLDSEKKLCLEFKPILPGWLFSQKKENGFPKNTFAFKFLNKTLVIYHNPKRKDTFGPKAAKIKEITLKPQDKPNVILKTSYINSPLALDVRAGKIARIDILLS